MSTAATREQLQIRPAVHSCKIESSRDRYNVIKCNAVSSISGRSVDYSCYREQELRIHFTTAVVAETTEQQIFSEET